VSDSQWLAELHAHGLLRPSFVAPEDVRRLRGYQRLRDDHIVMADGMGTGDVQWYLTRWGELGFGVHIGKNDDPTGWRYHHTQPLITNETVGSWVCLASVYDGPTDTVTQYFNGQPVGATQLGVRTLLQLETFEIGNWALRSGEQQRAGVVPRGAGDSARNFHGGIDELAIFSAPLSAEEIRRIYEQGQVNETDTRPELKTASAR
jgi:hypothetical protein